MIVHRAKKAGVRDVRRVNTTGMMPKTAARHLEREAGLASAREGKHAGGPCPAVCLATLTGWSYGEASRWLRERYGFRGAGMLVMDVDDAMREVFAEVIEVPVEATVGTTVRAQFHPRKSGYIRCRGHVMPVLHGRLLNAQEKHAHAACMQAFVIGGAPC